MAWKGDDVANLRSEFHHKLDAKGRLSLPADFRKALPKNLVVTPSPTEPCLYVFEDSSFDAWVESVFERRGGFDSSSLQDIATRRALNAAAKSVELDGSGRIGLNAQQREKAGLDKEVTLVGNGDHFEIWDAKRWEDFVGSVDLSAIFNG